MARQVVVNDPALGTRLVPGVRARIEHEGGGYLVAANAEGFRDDEWQKIPPPGIRRVLVYGDSFTYGVGVAADKRFTNLLAQAIPNAEFYNFAIVGSGTDQQFLTHRLVGTQFHFDLILSTPWVENIDRNLKSDRLWTTHLSPGNPAKGTTVSLQDKPYFVLDDGELELRNETVGPARPIEFEEYSQQDGKRFTPLDTLRWKLRWDYPQVKDSLQRLIRYQPAKLYKDPSGYAWQLYRAIFREWAAEATAPIMVCPIPMYQHIENDASAKQVRLRLEELHDPAIGLYTFDALPAMKAGRRRKRRELRFPKDIHFTEAGHAAYADAICADVAQMLDAVAPMKPGGR